MSRIIRFKLFANGELCTKVMELVSGEGGCFSRGAIHCLLLLVQKIEGVLRCSFKAMQSEQYKCHLLKSVCSLPDN